MGGSPEPSSQAAGLELGQLIPLSCELTREKKDFDAYGEGRAHQAH